MGLFDRVEGKLERAYNGLFARAFRAEVQPVEIASAIRRAMDDRATGTPKGRSVVPNLFTIELSETDYERLTDLGDDVSDELVVAAEEHVASQHYTPGGPVRIMLAEDAALETGVFRVRPATVKKPDATGRTGQQPRISDRAAQRRPEPAPAPKANTDDQHEPGYPEYGEPDYDEPQYSEPEYSEPEYNDGLDDYRDAARAGGGGARGSGARGSGSGSAASGAAAGAAGAAAGAAAAGALRRRAGSPAYDDDRDDRSHQRDHRDDRDDDRTAAAPPPPRKPRRPAHRPSLVIDGDDYPLTSAITILGRDDDADIILDDPGISRRHTELRVSVDGPGFITVIRDLGSTNGTFVNGERIDTEHLQDGDRITVGRTSMTYRVRTR